MTREIHRLGFVGLELQHIESDAVYVGLVYLIKGGLKL